MCPNQFFLIILVAGLVVAEDLASLVNNDPSLHWEADPMNRRYEEFLERGILGLDMISTRSLPVKNPIPGESVLPTSFDARAEWGPMCTFRIRNQGNCGSCWAHGASSSLEDRACIQSAGEANSQLSVEWLLSCDSTNFGCGGGNIERTWRFIHYFGLSTEKCSPYTSGSSFIIPKCSWKCDDGSSAVLRYVDQFYTVKGENNIMQEIKE